MEEIEERTRLTAVAANVLKSTFATRGLSLSAGRHVMRVFFDSVTSKRIAGHFNWFKLIKT